ncbi:MAG: TIR domain-containing protein [Pseudomonadota bacterium]
MTDRRTRVFISYARKDAEGVDRLVAELRGRNFDAYVDRDDIHPGEPWKERLNSLIRDADAIAFVLSPHSLASEVCLWEVDRARVLAKRIAPVLLTDVDAGTVPEFLARLNWIDCTAFATDASAGVAGARALDQLTAAVTTDIGWIREHTRYVEIAERWRDAGTPEGQLLRQSEIDRAEAWVRQQADDAPGVPDVVFDFIDASRQRERTERDRFRATIARGFAEPARFAMEQGRFDSAIRRLAAGAVLAEDLNFELEPDVFRIASRSIWSNSVRLRVEHAARVYGAAVSPDGRLFVTACGDGAVVVWNVRSGARVRTIQTPSTPVNHIAIDPTGTRILTVSAGKQALVWDLRSGESMAAFRHDDEVSGSIRAAHFAANAPLVYAFSAHFEPGPGIWNVATRSGVVLVADVVAPTPQAEFSPDGSLLVSWAVDGGATVWSARTGEAIASFDLLRAQGIVHASLSHDNRHLVLSSHNHAEIRALDDPEFIAFLPAAGAGAWYLTRFSPDGNYLVSAHEGCELRLWDAASQAELRVFRCHEAGLLYAAFTADSRQLITGCEDFAARVLDVDPEGHEINRHFLRDTGGAAVFDGDQVLVRTVDEAGLPQLTDIVSGHLAFRCAFGSQTPFARALLTPDRQFVVTEDADRNIALWDYRDGRKRWQYALSARPYSELRLIGDGATLLCQPSDRSFALLNTSDGRERLRLTPLTAQPDHEACVSGDGARIYTTSFHAVRPDDQNTGATVCVWDAVTGEQCDRFEIPGLFQFFPGERHLLVTDRDALRVLEHSSRREVCRIVPSKPGSHNDALMFATISPDGRYIATGTRQRSVKLWDAMTGACVADLRGHEDQPQFGAFSHDGRLLVTTSRDRTARVWNVAHCYEVLSLPCVATATDTVLHAQFAPDDERLLTTTSLGFLQLWDISRARASDAEAAVLIGAALPGIGQLSRLEREELLFFGIGDDLAHAFWSRLTDTQRRHAARVREVLAGQT